MSDVIGMEDLAVARDRVITELRAGLVVVMPSDTTYMLVADAFMPSATRALFRAKRRAPNVPLTVLIRTPRQVAGLAAEVPEAADRLMAAYWPGPLTIVLPVAEGINWDVGPSDGTVALRLPTDELTLGVVGDIGPLASSGANRYSQPLATTAAQVREELGDAAALYVDGGERAGPPTTIVDATRETIEVLREGAIPTDHIEQVIGGDLPWGARPDTEATADTRPTADTEPAPDTEPAADTRVTADTEPQTENRER